MTLRFLPGMGLQDLTWTSAGPQEFNLDRLVSRLLHAHARVLSRCREVLLPQVQARILRPNPEPAACLDTRIGLAGPLVRLAGIENTHRLLHRIEPGCATWRKPSRPRPRAMITQWERRARRANEEKRI